MLCPAGHQLTDWLYHTTRQDRNNGIWSSETNFCRVKIWCLLRLKKKKKKKYFNSRLFEFVRNQHLRNRTYALVLLICDLASKRYGRGEGGGIIGWGLRGVRRASGWRRMKGQTIIISVQFLKFVSAFCRRLLGILTHEVFILRKDLCSVRAIHHQPLVNLCLFNNPFREDCIKEPGSKANWSAMSVVCAHHVFFSFFCVFFSFCLFGFIGGFVRALIMLLTLRITSMTSYLLIN